MLFLFMRPMGVFLIEYILEVGSALSDWLHFLISVSFGAKPLSFCVLFFPKVFLGVLGLPTFFSALSFGGPGFCSMSPSNRSNKDLSKLF